MAADSRCSGPAFLSCIASSKMRVNILPYIEADEQGQTVGRPGHRSIASACIRSHVVSQDAAISERKKQLPAKWKKTGSHACRQTIASHDRSLP